jgi:hypothetical protein
MVANVFRVVAGVLSLAVLGYGARSCGSADFRQDAVLMGLFCILPLLSLPVFLLSFKWSRCSAALQWIFAVGYLAVYSMLDWRTCAELGYCRGVAWTVFETSKARPVEAYFAVAVFSLAALSLNGMRVARKGSDS